MPAPAHPGTLASAVSVGLCAVLVACSCSNVPNGGHGNGVRAQAGTPRRSTQRSADNGDGLARVANSDPSGADNQPDWNDLARQTKEMVGPRLPDPLPTDQAATCAKMLDAALTFYDATEADPLHKAARREELLATREADQKACEAQTSISAALCVTLLLGDKNAEFPWLLDQCTRAFP